MHPYRSISLDTPTEEALAVYCEMGFHSFLVHGIVDGHCTCKKWQECKSAGKHPVYAANPHGVSDATNDLGELYRRLAIAPYANIAVATGQLSGFFALDIDGRAGGFETAEALELKHGNFPRTLIVETGSGYHLYFRYPNGVDLRNKAGEIGPGVDQRGNGGYVIVPPSCHQSGKQYAWCWLAADDDETMPRRPAAMPSWLLQLALGSRESPKMIPPKAFIHRDREQRNHFGDGAIAEGSRNDALASKAGLMRGAGFTEAEIETALLKVNTDRCKPPLDDEEVRKIAHSIARYPSTFNTPPRPIFSPIKIVNGRVA